MGKKSDLKQEEKTQIVEKLSEGQSTLEIAKLLHRDHRTIKTFVRNSEARRKKGNKRNFEI